MALYPNHCFIPTVSALALGTTDLFYDIAGDPAILTMTPFDAVYFPLDNEEHVSVSPENAVWFLDEIELGVVGVASGPSTTPSITLSAPFPNPATGVSEIKYQLDTAGPIEITVYDVAGRRVASLLKAGNRPAGPGVVRLDGGAMASGVYFIRMQTQSSVRARKLTVVH